MKKKVFSVQEVKVKLEQYCIYQDRCHSEIDKKLSEYNLIPEAKEQITLHLLQENFLNEERFAKNFTLGKLKNNKWGRTKIKYYLQRKGVSPHNIEIALNQIDEDEYYKLIVEVATQKSALLNEKNIYKKQMKLSKHLYSKGFESDLIISIVEKIIKQ